MLTARMLWRQHAQTAGVMRHARVAVRAMANAAMIGDGEHDAGGVAGSGCRSWYRNMVLACLVWVTGVIPPTPMTVT